jgi:diguanylate cyclase
LTLFFRYFIFLSSIPGNIREKSSTRDGIKDSPMHITSDLLLIGGGIVVGLLLPVLMKHLNLQFFTELGTALTSFFVTLFAVAGRFLRKRVELYGGMPGPKVVAVQKVDPREQQISDSAQMIRTILLSITGLLQQAGQAANNSSSTLGDVRTTIDDIRVPQDLEKIHDLLIREIDRMISSNTNLKEELARSQYSLEDQRRQIENLKTAVRIDGLTQLANRKFFDEKLIEMIRLRGRYNDPFSLLMADVDDFKIINDTLGHQAGDRILRGIAIKLRASTRGSDFIARFGGDEFALILPKTQAKIAGEVGKKICLALKESRFILDGKEFTMTLSIGVTEVTPWDTPETMVKRADYALYQAKQEGRNRAIIAETLLENNESPRE